MKKAIIIGMAVIIGISAMNVQASWLSDQRDKALARIQVEDPELYAQLMELREQRNAILKKLAKDLIKLARQYKEEVKPLVKARLKITAALIRKKLSIFRKKAIARFHEEVFKAIDGLPDNVRPVVTDIVNSKAFKKAHDKAVEMLQQRIKEKLAELKVKLDEKIAELKEKAEDFKARINERIDEMLAS